MKKINILFIANKSEIGGAPKSMMDLVLELSKNCNITILTPIKGKIFNFCKENNINVIVEKFDSFLIYEGNTIFKKAIRRILLPILYIRHKLINTKAIKNIEKQIDLNEIDIIHTNLHRDDIGGILSKKYNIKHVVHLREYSNMDYKCISIMPNYIKYLNSYTDTFIAISETIKEYYISLKINNAKIKKIYNGINTDKIKKTKDKSKNDKLKIIFVGNITESKGQLIALEAINRIPENIRKKINITFIGQDDPIYRKTLNQYISKNNLKNIVNFVEYANNIPDILSNYDIGLMCSRAEAFGRVTVEYMAAGLITIAPNTGANPEIINNKVDGFIFDLNNIETLSKLITEIYYNINSMDYIRKKAIEKVEENFTYKINANNVYKTYIELMKKNGD